MSSPKVGLNISLTPRANQFAAKKGGGSMTFNVPPNVPMPGIGDKFRVLLAGEPVTFKVIDRELEYLPDHATIHILLDLL